MTIIHDLLNQAIIGEKTAVAHYEAYAEAALKEGKPGIASLFTTLAFAETVHVGNHKRAIQKEMPEYALPSIEPIDKSKVGSCQDNLTTSSSAEFEEFSEMYPDFKKQIQKALGNSFAGKLAILSIDWALGVEKTHHQLIELALKELSAGRDLIPEYLYVCEVCGNLHYDSKAPDSDCEICGHGYGFFRHAA